MNQNTPPKKHKLKGHEKYISARYEVVLVVEVTRIRTIRAKTEEQAVEFAIERERRKKYPYHSSLGDIHVINVKQNDRP